MTKVRNVSYSAISQRLSSWYLANPTTGNNTVQITFGSGLYTVISIACYSLTNSGGYGNSLAPTSSGDPKNITLSCSADSLIFARGQSYQVAGYISIDGTTYSYPNQLDVPSHNTNSQAWATLGTNSVASGNRVVSLDASSGECYGQAVELLGAVSATAPVIDSTTTATNIDSDNFSSGGNIVSDGGDSLIEIGVCFQDTPNPTTSDWKKTTTPAVGNFSVINIGYGAVIPAPETTIYYRAYAQNSIGTSYGPEKSFVSPAQNDFSYLHYVGRGVGIGVGVGIC